MTASTIDSFLSQAKDYLLTGKGEARREVTRAVLELQRILTNPNMEGQ